MYFYQNTKQNQENSLQKHLEIRIIIINFVRDKQSI